MSDVPDGDLGAFLDRELFPAMYRQLDRVFPEFAWREGQRSWVATRWPEELPYPVDHPRPDRLEVYADAPHFIKVHGHTGLTWFQYLSGGATPRGAAFIETVKQLAARVGVDVPSRELSPEQAAQVRFREERRRCLSLVIEMAHYILMHAQQADEAADYLDARGFETDAMEKLGFGFYDSAEDFRAMLEDEGCDTEVAEQAGLLWPKLEGYILVPWMDAAGVPLTIYGRWFEKIPPEGRPKTIALRGKGTKSSPLYLDRALRAGHRDLVAVEGVFDAALLQARGDTRVVAYVAAQFNQNQVKALARYNINSVTIAPDPDGGGDRGALSSVALLEGHGIRSYVAPRLPDGLDPDEFVIAHGLDAWRDHVDRAAPGRVHQADVMLASLTPDSSEAERRSTAEEVARHAARLEGAWADEDRLQIIERVAAAAAVPTQTISALITTAPAPLGRTQDPHHTDMGNAARLAQRHGHDLKYVSGMGWLAWDGRRWVRDATGEVERRAKETILALYQEAGTIEDEDARQALIAHARRSEGAYRLAGMVNLARTEARVVARAEDLDNDPLLLNAMNGTIDLRTGKLRPHRREDLITKLAPVAYHPEARCPRFDEFVDQIFDGNDDVIEFIQRAAGYALTGDTREQVLMYLYGTGANGKSTLLLLLMHILGEYAKQAAPNILVAKKNEEHPTAVADLFGARLVVTTEVESGKTLAEALVKQITGGDKLKARFMRQDFFEFTPTFKVFLAANHKLLVKGTDHAIWRRIRMVPFAVTIPEERRDKTLLEKLKVEAPGILAWAVQGCLEWQRQGLGTPKEVTAATAAYREQMDILAHFIEECCEVGEGFKVNAGKLYKAYMAWCAETGEFPTSQRVFGERVSDRGFDRSQSDGKRVRLGLKLTAVPGGAGSGACSGMTPNVLKRCGRTGNKGH